MSMSEIAIIEVIINQASEIAIIEVIINQGEQGPPGRPGLPEDYPATIATAPASVGDDTAYVLARFLEANETRGALKFPGAGFRIWETLNLSGLRGLNAEGVGAGA